MAAAPDGPVAEFADGDLPPVVDASKEHYRVAALDRVDDPPAMTFVDVSGRFMNTVAPADASLFDSVATVVAEEPLDAVDPETAPHLMPNAQARRPLTPNARVGAQDGP